MKNERGISLIALIITIIVIIILAAIVIGSVLNAPDQANFAKYCQDYSEIQSAVQTQAALLFGEKAVSTLPADAGYTMTKAYLQVCTGVTTDPSTGYITDKDTEPTAKCVKIDKGQATKTDGMGLGLSSLPDYVTWYVNVLNGELYSSVFNYDTVKYNTPQGPVTPADFAAKLVK